MLEESRPFFRDRSVAKFPLPLRERERVRGDKKNQAPSPQSSPVKGEEVRGGSGILNLFFLFALFVLLTPNQGNSQTKEKVRVALRSISVNTSMILVCVHYGTFVKYGVVFSNRFIWAAG